MTAITTKMNASSTRSAPEGCIVNSNSDKPTSTAAMAPSRILKVRTDSHDPTP